MPRAAGTAAMQSGAYRERVAQHQQVRRPPLRVVEQLSWLREYLFSILRSATAAAIDAYCWNVLQALRSRIHDARATAEL